MPVRGGTACDPEKLQQRTMGGRWRWIVASASLLLAACASHPSQMSSASNAPLAAETDWAFERSDIPVDPAFRFGRLENGMRYIVRRNATPQGTAIVRMQIGAGSLDESDQERGYAHFVEHMAFNGSTNVPEGEMVRLLEREGLAFGADTNASTGFEATTYKLDLPRNDPALLDLSLMLMRETASELTFSPAAVNRERGVVLSEMRDRNTYALREAVEGMHFFNPGALYPDRLPIGTADTLNAATAQTLKSFWSREYVPGNTTVVVIGDFDPALMEAKIRERFMDWRGAAPEPQPDAGPISYSDGGRTDVYIDPALTERVEADRHGPWLHEPDTVKQRRENLLRKIGYDIVNRRLQRMSRTASPPFRGAGYGTGDIFKAGRTTRLIVDTGDKKWRNGLIAAATEYRRALKYGFTRAEVAEQIAIIRTALENAAAAADTRTHGMLEGAVWALVQDDMVPSDPREVLSRFAQFAPGITPKNVLAALKREAVVLESPLLRFRGNTEPVGGAEAIRAAWAEAMGAKIRKDTSHGLTEFGYTQFGKAGNVISDTREPLLGIRTVRFANGVMLNLKHTDIEKDRIRLKVSLDGGEKLNTREFPNVTELVPYLAEGGLRKHSEDDLQTLLAGRTVENEFQSHEASVSATARTTPRDLELQLQLWAAYVTDPGYRSEAIEEYRNDINRYFTQLNATPSSALSGAAGAILSDNDPRFSLQGVETYRRLTFGELSHGMADRLAHGAIEIGIVGDVDEDQAIALVSSTFGALPAREPEFRAYADQPPRQFTADRHIRILRHTGPKDQAVVRLVWPTRDDSDPVAAMALALLERIARVEITDTLRESLGKAYSPGASSALSRYWPGYGTFTVTASVAVPEIPATRKALETTIAGLRTAPVSQDILLRARQPMLERYQNELKSNTGWLALVDRTQSEASRIERYVKATERLNALTPKDIQDMAIRYLDPAQGLEILVLPEGIAPPQ